MIKGLNTALVVCAALASSVSLAEEMPDPEQRCIEAML